VLPLRLAAPPDRPLRVLALGAHCDDIEIGAGGTILRLIAEYRAIEICWLVCASDPVRKGEAHASAAGFAAGATRLDIIVGDFPENVLPSHGPAVREFLIEHGRRFAPDLVLSPHRHDLHQDHRLLGELSLQLFRDHPVFEYEIAKYDGDLHTPNVYVVLEPELVDQKVALLHQHFSSQSHRPWFDAEAFRGLLRLRGIEVNTRYAEGFHTRKLVL
jgi:LmbE family N-acetylglucosaminyl deacetylase